LSANKFVALGGGHGLPMVLKALKDWAEDITAIVTIADDGGSSGQLRYAFNMPPPGDSRNCLVALARNSLMSNLFQYRFEGGSELNSHSLGNLVIAALTKLEGSFDKALATAGKILNCQGEVLPPTDDLVELVGTVDTGAIIYGQCNLANRLKPLASIWLEPGNPRANQKAVEAIRQANYLILGPGSLFTSIVPSLLVPEICQAIKESQAKKIYLLNIMNQPGETDGFSGFDHLQVIEKYVGKKIDVVVVDKTDFPAPTLMSLAKVKIHPVETDLEGVRNRGIKCFVGELADESKPTYHDPEKLKKILLEICQG
jgi:uncharacterized cofD-like protein